MRTHAAGAWQPAARGGGACCVAGGVGQASGGCRRGTFCVSARDSDGAVRLVAASSLASAAVAGTGCPRPAIKLESTGLTLITAPCHRIAADAHGALTTGRARTGVRALSPTNSVRIACKVAADTTVGHIGIATFCASALAIELQRFGVLFDRNCARDGAGHPLGAVRGPETGLSQPLGPGCTVTDPEPDLGQVARPGIIGSRARADIATIVIGLGRLVHGMVDARRRRRIDPPWAWQLSNRPEFLALLWCRRGESTGPSMPIGIGPG
jgi:hypothetical protein